MLVLLVSLLVGKKYSRLALSPPFENRSRFSFSRVEPLNTQVLLGSDGEWERPDSQDTSGWRGKGGGPV